MQNKGVVVYNRAGGYTGWIGNLMFQMMATVGIAVKNNMDYLFADTGYYDRNFFSFFSGEFPIASPEELAKSAVIELSEPSWGFHDFGNLDPSKNYNLSGYFQSDKYWSHCDDQVRELFQFAPEVHQYNYRKYYRGVNGNHPVIPPSLSQDTRTQITSLHVRRGDYLKHPNEHTVMDVDYYVKAAQYLDHEHMIYLVFSDDIAWCREQFNDLSIFKGRIYYAEGNEPHQDMHMMSTCDNNVIACSSFSWMASYLNISPNKKVIAPPKDKWFGSARKDWKVDDMYRDDFIILP